MVWPFAAGTSGSQEGISGSQYSNGCTSQADGSNIEGREHSSAHPLTNSRSSDDDIDEHPFGPCGGRHDRRQRSHHDQLASFAVIPIPAACPPSRHVRSPRRERPLPGIGWRSVLERQRCVRRGAGHRCRGRHDGWRDGVVGSLWRWRRGPRSAIPRPRWCGPTAVRQARQAGDGIKVTRDPSVRPPWRLAVGHCLACVAR